MNYYSTTTVIDSTYPIPIDLGTTTPKNWRAIYQLSLPALCVGDVLQITGACTAVNGTSYNVQFVDAMTLGAWPLRTEDCPVWGWIIKPAGGMNITPANHYWRGDAAWQFQVPEAIPGCLLEWRVLCHADNANGSTAPILQGYGGMQVNLIRA